MFLAFSSMTVQTPWFLRRQLLVVASKSLVVHPAVRGLDWEKAWAEQKSFNCSFLH